MESKPECFCPAAAWNEKTRGGGAVWFRQAARWCVYQCPRDNLCSSPCFGLSRIVSNGLFHLTGTG